MSDSTKSDDGLRWYQGISSYQWMVLTIASLGWVFDIFEGQIFVASMTEAMPSLLGVAPDAPAVTAWNDWAFASFLLGGAFGGVLFGVVSDRIGRSKTMILTILFYSVFTCISAFAQAPWQMVVLRFLVAMGVGGEWAVASAMVAEVMPTRSRPVMSSIFHASSVFGTLLAAAAGAFIVGNEALGDNAWRWGFAIGVLPALLTIWIRWKMKEPEQWQQSQTRDKKSAGNIMELFTEANLKNTMIGVGLSSIGLITFWGCHIYGKNALKLDAQRRVLRQENVAEDADKKVKQEVFAKHRSEIKKAEMLSMVLNTIGGGLGLVLFGVISNRLGRKGAFVLYHLVASVLVIIMFQGLIKAEAPYWLVALVLPVFGFFTLGMHAGYAVYFPELYPTRLRGTGTGYCFNMGRLATAGFLFLSAHFKLDPFAKAYLVFPLYIVGAIIVMFAEETRGVDLRD